MILLHFHYRNIVSDNSAIMVMTYVLYITFIKLLINIYAEPAFIVNFLVNFIYNNLRTTLLQYPCCRVVFPYNTNNNNIYLKSNIQKISIDYK